MARPPRTVKASLGPGPAAPAAPAAPPACLLLDHASNAFQEPGPAPQVRPVACPRQDFGQDVRGMESGNRRPAFAGARREEEGIDNAKATMNEDAASALRLL